MAEQKPKVKTHMEIVCAQEGDVVVGVLETTGPMDASTIVRGLKSSDPRRLNRKKIKDGVQLLCERCQSPLFFRGRTGDKFAAVPGSITVEA